MTDSGGPKKGRAAGKVPPPSPAPPSPAPPSPAGPEEREKTVDALCEAFANDEMDVDEFERRVEMAHRVETTEQLGILVADLRSARPPAKVKGRGREAPPQAPPRPERALTPLGPRPSVPAERVPDNSLTVGILGGGGRTGSWVPARTNWAMGLMGGCELDFRDAIFGPGITEVRVFTMWGGVEVVVPPDVQVECSGLGIMGAFEQNSTVQSTVDPDAPILRVTGLALMGGVEVVVRYPGETARDAKRRLRDERRARKQLGKGG